MDKAKHRRLQELDRSNYEIVKGEPDIRGWDVKYLSGQKLGTVEELILDTEDKKVRYMVVDLEENELKLIRRKILIPIGFAELDKIDDDVLIPNISVEQLSRLPDYDKNNLDAGVERRISSTLGREIHAAELAEASHETTLDSKTERKISKEKGKEHQIDYNEIDPDFYRHEQYNLDNLYKNRLHEVPPSNNESEYERGLKLWERRSEGGLIGETVKEIDEQERAERIKNRRRNYRQKRYNEGG